MPKLQEFEEIPYDKNMMLHVGDIILKDGHVVIIVEGSEIPYEQWVGECYGLQFVPVYTKPDTNSARCSWPTLAAGNLFDVYGENGNFYFIRIAGEHFGYIQKAFVLRKTVKTTGNVTSAVHVRTNPGASYKSIGILEGGTKVEICDVKPASNGADWYYIRYKDGWGFSSAKYIKVK